MVGGGVLADRQRGADLPVAEALRRRAPRICASRGERPSGSAAPRGVARRAARILASSAGIPIRSASAAASPSSARRAPGRPAARAQQQARVLVGGVREPRGGAHAAVELQRPLEVRLGRARPRRAWRPACRGSGRPRRSRTTRWPIITLAPASGSSSGYTSAATASSPSAAQASVRYVERGQPQRLAERLEPLRASRDSSRRASASMPSSASSATSPGRHGPSRAARRPGSGSPARARPAARARAGR